MTGRANLKVWFVMAFVWLCLPSIAAAVERYVPSQYPTIQSAIDDCNDGDVVIVAPGIYTGTGNRDIDFLGKAITVRSTGGPENCIIDCQATIEDMHRGFYFHTSEGPGSILDGFTITNGVAYYGGGLRCGGSSPIIRRCRIIGNYSRWRDGGGIFCESNSSPQILDSIVMENVADDDGGGICCEQSSNAIISNCVISNNTAARDGGGVVSWYSSEVMLKNCVLAGNHAGRNGGGLEAFHDSPVLFNCLIVGNSAPEGGGAQVFDSPNFTLSNCTIANNTAGWRGGAIRAENSSVNLRNSILYGNLSNQISFYDSSIIAEYSNIEGGWSGTGNIDADPCFVEPGYWDTNGLWIDGDYHLLHDSPCINAGDPNFIPEPNETDIDGELRVMLGRVDMGADEFNPFEIEFNVVDKRRIGRTLFEYDCVVTVTNISLFSVRNIELEIVKASENMTIIDPTVTFGDIEIAPGESAASLDMCTFQVDRSEATEPARIIWQSACEVVGGVPGAQDIASGICLLNLGIIAGDITGDDKVDFEDLNILAEQWLQPPGIPSADIAPPDGDNIVNFLDFALLAENWLQEL